MHRKKMASPRTIRRNIPPPYTNLTHDDFVRSLAYFADMEDITRECVQRDVFVCRWYDHQHTQAHVKRMEHLIVGNVPHVLYEVENRQFWPSATTDDRADSR